MRRVCALALAALALLPIPASAQGDIKVVLYASGFSAPLAVVQDPTNRSVQFVVEQGGRIRVVQNGVVLGTDFLNLSGAISSGGERGLLGMALAPDYASSGRFFVNFTNTAGHTVVARFQRSSNPLVADPSTRFDLRWNGPDGPAYIAQPFANHNGGCLAFGPDGFLYIGMGDGGDANDPGNRAQNPSELLGKMLRVDVNLPDGDAIGYRVPSNNPFVSGSPIAGAHRDLGVRIAEPVALQLRRSRARRHRCAGHRRRRPECLGGSGLRAGRPWRPQLRVAAARRQPRQRHVGAAGLSAALRPDPRVRPRHRPIDHRWLRLSRRRALGLSWPLFFCRLRPGPGVVARALD